MSFYIPKTGNVLVEYQTGDGFKTVVLPNYISDASSVIVTSKPMMKHYCMTVGVTAITIHALKKFMETDKFDGIKTIFIDTQLPRTESKAHKNLMQLCKGRRIIFIQQPHDLRAVSSAMELLSVTKGVLLKTISFSNYIYFGGGR
jgi:hypothetical protein